MSDPYIFNINLLQSQLSTANREITRLRARVEQLEKALKDVAEYCCDEDPTISTVEYIARMGMREIK